MAEVTFGKEGTELGARLSRVLKTKDGDEIRVLITPEGTAVLRSVRPAGPGSDISITVIPPSGVDVAEIDWGAAWDKLKKVGKALLDSVIDAVSDGGPGEGGGGNTVNVHVHGGGTVIIHM